MNDQDQISQFEAIVLPHLDAAYNLARWLTRNNQDADDLVQMVFVRALKFFGGFHGGNARAWLLTIVRHTFYTTLRDNQHEDANIDFDEAALTVQSSSSYDIGYNPESSAISHDTSRVVNQALEQLPVIFREVIILKEIEEFSYQEIAEIIGIPIGTVMSRLARARKLLSELLNMNDIGGAS